MTDNTDTQINIPEYMTIIQREAKHRYVAFHPELSDTIAQGYTSEDAEVNLAVATKMVLAYFQENDFPVPKAICIGDPRFTQHLAENGISDVWIRNEESNGKGGEG